MASTRKLENVMKELFPNGTQLFYVNGSKPDVGATWPEIPDFPPDLFGAAAHLLELAGAYHYAVPPEAAQFKQGSAILFGDSEHRDWIEAGRHWARTPYVIPNAATRLWKALGQAANHPIFVEHLPNMPVPKWWKSALGLLIIADEACGRVGFAQAGMSTDTTGYSWVWDWVQFSYHRVLNELLDKAKRGNNRSGHIRLFPQFSSIALRIDPDVACVLPKARTPALGSTMRTLSHNVALLPPRGIVKASWQTPPSGHLVPEDKSALNLLLIPLPFKVAASWFTGEPYVTASHEEPEKPLGNKWGWFSLRQYWLDGPVKGCRRAAAKKRRRAAVVSTVKRLIVKAKKDIKTLHGVVLPEYALDWPTYEALVNMIRSEFADIEFIVSGSSSNCQGEVGNVALATVFAPPAVQSRKTKKPAKRSAISLSRAKHHRWRLDETQISGYAVASALDPRRLWWEKIVVPKRQIHVNVFRSSSTFTTMICEDLARVDPCHSVLRSVAPSLVFVLLMDGPQIAQRWSARYATVLADDPGSSVLALTSLGLIDRANRAGSPVSRSIALWKDDTGKMVNIALPENHHAVLLTLSGVPAHEQTFDGRENMQARAWRFHGQQPIPLSAATAAERQDLILVEGGGDG